MKRFIFNLIFFLFLPTIIIGIGLELSLRQIPNDFKYKLTYLDSNSNNIEVLILGDSHTYYGLDPKYFNFNTFNASEIAQTLEYDYEILKKYDGRLKNLKTIVLPISYITLYKNMSKDPNSWRIKNYVIYYKMHKEQSVKDRFEILSNSLEINIRRLYSYYIKGVPNITCSSLGWGSNYNSINAKDLIETGKINAKNHTCAKIHSAQNIRTKEANILMLNSIMEWSKKRNVNVLLVTPPAFETYRQNLEPEQLKITLESAKLISSTYSNCTYINMICDTSFKAIDFYDADHLSDIGAYKFSTYINRTISNGQ
jgi:hypothetical protein